MIERLGKKNVLVASKEAVDGRGAEIVATWSIYKTGKGAFTLRNRKRVYVTPVAEPYTVGPFSIEYTATIG